MDDINYTSASIPNKRDTIYLVIAFYVILFTNLARCNKKGQIFLFYSVEYSLSVYQNSRIDFKERYFRQIYEKF